MKSIKDILEAAKMKGKDPCWKDYQMVGMKNKNGKQVPNCVPVKEAKDEKEYGYEGDMALNQLTTLIRCGEMIKDMLKPDTDLPEWVQSKITLATDYIQTAADYLYSEMKEEVKQIDEIDIDEGIVNKIRSANYDRLAQRSYKQADKTKPGQVSVYDSNKMKKGDDRADKANKLKEEVELDENLSKMPTDKLQKHWNSHKDEQQPSPAFASKLKMVAKELAKRKSMKKESVEDDHQLAVQHYDSDDKEKRKHIQRILIDKHKAKAVDVSDKATYFKIHKDKVHEAEKELRSHRIVTDHWVNGIQESVKGSADSDGGPPTPAAATLTVTGQPKLTKTVGQTKMVPYVHEDTESEKKEAEKKSGSWKVESPWKKVKGNGTVIDKSGAKHTPMSRARDLARSAFTRKVTEQSNVQPNPFTIPATNPGAAPAKKPEKPVSAYAQAKMTESRQLEIVREAMKVAKKKKEVTETGSDKFIADPELTSQITKSNP